MMKLMSRFVQSSRNLFFITLAVLCLPACSSLPLDADEEKNMTDGSSWSLAIHGGAFVIDPDAMTDQERSAIENALQNALAAGAIILREGGRSVDAVEAALVVLEDAPQFNAGKGAVFNSVGSNELDASIMDGANLQSGAVAGVKRVRNPIRAARLVMDRSKHVYLQGDGADEFAESEGLVPVNPDYFYTLRRWNQLLEV